MKLLINSSSKFTCTAATFFLTILFLNADAQTPKPVAASTIITPLKLTAVKITDSFWAPKLKVWDTKTVYDVFDKLEGKFDPDRPDMIAQRAKTGRARNAFLNFDRVAAGQKDTKDFDGEPWFDGLVYETIRGAADLLVEYPDANLEKKIDAYIDRIAAAQAVDPDGYLNTYTTLNRSNQRWGTNGGDDKWQHDIYNSGMLADAAAHYYNATGKTKLLNVAVKLSNYICNQIGSAPKLNVIPGHGGPEEALLNLYLLFKNNPALKSKMTVPVKEKNYYDIAKFWIEERGNYGEADGSHARHSDSSYNQDHLPVFQQTTIEGHAVRATLLATGVSAMALETGDSRYIQTANNYWDNMIGKRMFITGGEGAIADGERFGKDYYLPESAYLETCAAIGAGFFSQRMNELQADGKYMDEFERIIYNNMLSGVSLAGDRYFYENPLIATDHKRWVWHGCPCCPPMFLKMVSALPGYIYGKTNNALYVNLFIGSEAKVTINKNIPLTVKQVTSYPWQGEISIAINPATETEFAANVRIPGWAQNKENPYDLYHSQTNGEVTLKVNGVIIVPVIVNNGYATITRKWKKGDVIALSLPTAPRVVVANDAVETVKDKMVIAAGPVVYSLEEIDNAGLSNYTFTPGAPLTISYKPGLLNGVSIITGEAKDNDGKTVIFTAIPFYAIGNRQLGSPYKVWLPVKN
ncbi:MAG: beta-L-arabinofuranosidase domain-containing protein [Bacteroidota bacterium]